MCAMNRDFFPDETVKARYTTVQTQRMYFMRSLVVAYFAGSLFYQTHFTLKI